MLAAITIPTADFSQFTTAVSDYYLCESTGSNAVCARNFERFNSRMVLIAALLIVGMFPVVNLIYVLNVQEIKKILSRRLKKRRTQQTLNQISLRTINSSTEILK